MFLLKFIKLTNLKVKFVTGELIKIVSTNGRKGTKEKKLIEGSE
jgi:uncharacterized protein Veg